MPSKTFHALANEAGLAAGHLMAGVTAMSKANYAEKAFYYQAFFSLSTGLERTCKLILICNHFLTNDQTFPTEKVVRSYGHNLEELVEHVSRLGRVKDLDYPLPSSEIHKEMLRVLSTFATNGTRYYNIDTVLGKALNYEDPLADWYKSVVLRCWQDCVRPSVKHTVESNARMVGALLGQFTFIQHTSEEGEPLNEVYEASLRTGIWERSAPYVRLHALQWSRFVGELLSSFSYNHADFPVFSEFYGKFYNPDSYLKSRKTWSLQAGR
ncbi:MAG TPA: hypothetical protein VLA04_03795 [Verrucomicrobiae bacterium]|nr:hypothetical protein [Verrucomicrobiae bacterium]